MANPVFVDCPADTWTLAAENVTAGQVHRVLKNPGLYLQTYRMTGEAAPTDIDEGVPAFTGTDSETIEAAHAIDVYIMARTNAGRVRVDVP